MDIQGYLQRIGYSGPVEPTLPVLRAIVLAHTCAVPFENIDVLLNQPIVLTEDALYKKLVLQRRGGYCFEQNGLLEAILTTIGFSVVGISARVRIDAPRTFIPPRTHLFLQVVIDSTNWLVDVGVGGPSPTGPLQLDVLDAEQHTPHDVRRIVKEDSIPFPRYYHQVKYGSTWVDICEFTREAMPQIDREISNWWTSTNPGSKFKKNLFVAKACPDGSRLSIMNQRFTRRYRGEIVEERDINQRTQLNSILADQFDLHCGSEVEISYPSCPW